jgi:hypothetical protein
MGPDGTLNLEWVQNISNGSAMTGNISWIDIDMNFWTD